MTDVYNILDIPIGGLKYFSEGKNTTSPNSTIPVESLSGAGTETDIDVSLVPKGWGAITAQIADNTIIGGNKRGINAVDLQIDGRSAASQVAGAANSVLIGGGGNEIGTNNAGSAIIGGISNTMSGTGQGSFIAGGNSNSISGNYSFICGSGNTISGTESFSSGTGNTLSGNRTASFGWNSNDRGSNSRIIHGAYPPGSSTGQHQYTLSAQGARTTDATPTILTVDGNVAVASNICIMPSNSAFLLTAFITARDNATGNMSAWQVSGVVKQGAGAGTTAIVGVPTVTLVAQDAGAVGWTVSLVADTTLGAAEIQVTGAAATTIKWFCKFESAEVVG